MEYYDPFLHLVTSGCNQPRPALLAIRILYQKNRKKKWVEKKAISGLVEDGTFWELSAPFYVDLVQTRQKLKQTC